MDNFFNSIKVIAIDHIAVTTPYLDETAKIWLSFPGASISKGPGYNESQKVNYCFIKIPNETQVEILSPAERSPLKSLLKKGGGPYHYCYQVRNLSESTKKAIELGCNQISEVKPDPAFNNKPVVFLYHTLLGFFELVEVD